MSLDLENATEAAKRNDLQEAILNLCEAVRQIENRVLYLEAETMESEKPKDLRKKVQKRKARKSGV